MYDLIIVGSGPAGLTAAIYATRAKLNFIIIEQNFMSGGQVVNTYEVDNYHTFSILIQRLLYFPYTISKKVFCFLLYIKKRLSQ